MLDLGHPHTQHIFRASAIQDRIRVHIRHIKEGAEPADCARRFEDIAQRIIPELHQLNRDHFGSSAGITRHLEEIALAATQQDVELCGRLFHAMADGMGDNNFGTWAI
ncbi:hypothetical protein PGB34_16710 [Xenophilus arseniciresistens]|uniref:Uncharacterized protein n=1 Tax=Xenophilus arseniciresistens TaxID=1283306 RepID=A0AAE3T0A2_9BURK|nr:hypothetical protein [Xenophilus arseniciresistens]MDA7418007.1 hypothetical protein [Xenophilus arseniciresistens]